MIMQTITIELNIPDSLMNDNIIEKFAAYHGWTSDRPETALDFSKSYIAKYVKDTAKNSFVNESIEGIRSKKSQEFDNAFNNAQ